LNDANNGLKLRPDDQRCLRTRAASYDKLNRFSESLNEYDNLILMFPSETVLPLLRAKVAKTISFKKLAKKGDKLVLKPRNEGKRVTQAPPKTAIANKKPSESSTVKKSSEGSIVKQPASNFSKPPPLPVSRVVDISKPKPVEPPMLNEKAEETGLDLLEEEPVMEMVIVTPVNSSKPDGNGFDDLTENKYQSLPLSSSLKPTKKEEPSVDASNSQKRKQRDVFEDERPVAAPVSSPVLSASSAPPPSERTPSPANENVEKKPKLKVRVAQTPVYAKAIADYVPGDATQDTDLAFKKGDEILVVHRYKDGWWKGKLKSKENEEKQGLFPSTYVRLLETKEAQKN
jgi:hypothetical protein